MNASLTVPGTWNQSSASRAAFLMGASIPAGETSEKNVPALPLDPDSAFYACQRGTQALRPQKNCERWAIGLMPIYTYFYSDKDCTFFSPELRILRGSSL